MVISVHTTTITVTSPPSPLVRTVHPHPDSFAPPTRTDDPETSAQAPSRSDYLLEKISADAEPWPSPPDKEAHEKGASTYVRRRAIPHAPIRRNALGPRRVQASPRSSPSFRRPRAQTSSPLDISNFCLRASVGIHTSCISERTVRDRVLILFANGCGTGPAFSRRMLNAALCSE